MVRPGNRFDSARWKTLTHPQASSSSLADSSPAMSALKYRISAIDRLKPYVSRRMTW